MNTCSHPFFALNTPSDSKTLSYPSSSAKCKAWSSLYFARASCAKAVRWRSSEAGEVVE